MSHEKCQSISRIRQTADGKWTATIFSAVNNVRPLYWRKVDFIPQESKLKMIAVILHDIYNGNIHMQGKSPYGTFLDELKYNVATSPAMAKIQHYDNIRDRVWGIASDNNYWHGKDIKKKMDEKCERIRQKCYRRIEETELDLAREFLAWKPCKDKYTICIDGRRVVSYRCNPRSGSKWWYCQPWDITTKSKVFTVIEKCKIEKLLAGRHKVTSEKVTADNSKGGSAA